MKLITMVLLSGTIQTFAQSLEMIILSVQNPVMNLNGIWKINNKPERNTLTDKKFILWRDITVPGANNWKPGESFRMEFLEKKSVKLIDVEKVTLSGAVEDNGFKPFSTGSIDVEEKESQLIVRGKDFTVPVNRNTVMIEDAVYKRNVLIKSGPYIIATIEGKTVNLRKTYWSVYPENHLGSPIGNTALYNNLSPIIYSQNPNRDWALDDKNFYYFGLEGSNVQLPLVNQAKAMKENIREYSLLSDTRKAKFVVTSSDNSVACRLLKPSDQELILNIDTYWDYPEIGWGNYSKSKIFGPFRGRISFHFQ